MRTDSKKEIRVAVLFTAAFLLGGLIHVAAGPWDFTSCIAQIYYSSLVLTWTVSVNYRIVNKKVRLLMSATSALLMLAFFLQMCRYRIFEYFETFRRYGWYGYYIPVILVPVLFLFVVLYLHLQEDEKPDRRWLLMLIPSVFLVLLVMTNDVHQLVFLFPDGAEGNTGNTGTFSHGALFYGIYVWFFSVLALSVVLAIKQCRITNIGKKLWMPTYFAGFSVFIVLALFDAPKIRDVSVWLLIECLAMLVIGMEESCIRLGLIPANSSYRTIARLADKPFIISDEGGTQVYAAESAREMFRRKDNVQIHTKPIRGGSVSWAVDLTEITALNREIEKVTESIESRNAFLQTENALKEEQTRLAARNALYNQIAGTVRPQLDAIDRMLDGTVDDAALARIAVLNAYIKRRSNMELLRSDRRHFPTEELASAIRESCEYLKLCGVNAMLYVTPECELAADMQLFLYESFEIAAESCLDTLQQLLVNITMRKSQPVLRIALKAPSADADTIRRRLSANGGTVCVSADDGFDEMTVTVIRQEGGRGI